MRARNALILLLAGDAILIGIALAYHYAVHNGAVASVPELFQLNEREGIPSVYLMLKWVVMFASLYWIARRTGRRWMTLLATLFLLLWIDDWGEVHEHMGDILVAALGLRDMFGLDADDIGELIFLVPFGLICFGLLAQTIRTAGPHLYRALAVLFGLLVLLAFFGVVMDLAAQMARGAGSDRFLSLRFILHFGEDAGEMVVASLMLAQAMWSVELDRADLAGRG